MNSIGIAILLLVVGLLLSLNPFGITIFTSLLAGGLGKGHPKAKMHAIAMTYLLFYWVLTAVLGVIMAAVLGFLSTKNLQVLALIVGGLIILWGMVTLKYYFWDKSRSRMPLRIHGILHTHTVKKSSPYNAMILGMAACLISFGSIGLQLMALAIVVALLAPLSPQWMLLPALSLILPLILIFWQVLYGFKVSAILKWKSEAAVIMRLGLALVNIALGWLILLILNGSIGVTP